jgi:triosephosphate isomerase (TIM)
MARTRLVAGNWKMHGSRESIDALLDEIVAGAGAAGAQCIVCPPFPYLGQAAERLRGTPVAWGAQNAAEHASGAYTGEVSVAMLAEFGCRYVIVGHSERRQIYRESDAQVAAKFAAVRSGGLTPILCLGETLAEREAGRTEEVVARQLAAVKFERGVLAYEPVWAIGTGEVATAADAQEVCAAIRQELGTMYSPRLSDTVRVIYGGSVAVANIADIMAGSDVDGALVGGASLDPVGFAALCQAGIRATTVDVIDSASEV